MLAKFGPTVAALLTLAFGGVALLYYAGAEPSTEAIDADLKTIRADIKSATDESAKYNGGLIKIMIETRKQILQTTGAMLESKRTSILRRIDLKYQVNGKAVASADDVTIRPIDEDIEKAKLKLKDDQAVANGYSGGLLESISLMAVATDQAALSQLYLAYYAKKYGLATPVDQLPSTSKVPRQGPLGNVVKDRDAL